MCDLTRDAKVDLLINYCGGFIDCEPDCPLYKSGHCNSDTFISRLTESQLDEMLVIADLVSQPTEDIPIEYDVIKKPKHYCREGAMECIDEMVLLFGKEAVKHFCLCNIWKYRYRSNDKNGKEDIEKSDRYVQIYKELCESYG